MLHQTLKVAESCACCNISAEMYANLYHISVVFAFYILYIFLLKTAAATVDVAAQWKCVGK